MIVIKLFERPFQLTIDILAGFVRAVMVSFEPSKKTTKTVDRDRPPLRAYGRGAGVGARA